MEVAAATCNNTGVAVRSWATSCTVRPAVGPGPGVSVCDGGIGHPWGDGAERIAPPLSKLGVLHSDEALPDEALPDSVVLVAVADGVQ